MNPHLTPTLTGRVSRVQRRPVYVTVNVTTTGLVTTTSSDLPPVALDGALRAIVPAGQSNTPSGGQLALQIVRNPAYASFVG